MSPCSDFSMDKAPWVFTRSGGDLLMGRQGALPSRCWALGSSEMGVGLWAGGSLHPGALCERIPVLQS